MTITVQDFDNAELDLQTISEVTNNNGYIADTTTNRTGATINTLLGALEKLGFQPPVVYGGGINFSTLADNTKTVDRGGTVYAPLPSEIPFTTTGTWFGSDENKFYVIQQQFGGDASTLNGQPGSFYQDASNLNAGTVPVGRLSGTYGISISGNAATATNATNATNATLAATATNANNLNNQAPGYYLTSANQAYANPTSFFAVTNVADTLTKITEFGQQRLFAAWVVFNGQTGAIANDFNVNTVAVSGNNAIYTITYTLPLNKFIPLPRNDYGVFGIANPTGGGVVRIINVSDDYAVSMTANSVKVECKNGAGSVVTGGDRPTYIFVGIVSDWVDYTI